MYTITYTDNSGDDQIITLSNWQDAEKVAAYLATLPLYTNVILTDGFRDLNYSTLQITLV